ncbi:hypothetical protein QTG56_23080 (plasmid) [Rossellomorea sp. AcN35-11]|nr:hypothetical protein QTG56_23080 [Rossellomorea sp. AcN35-11]
MTAIDTLKKQFIKGDAILTGVDSGNTSTKVSVLNKKGDIETYQFPTVIAKAPMTVNEITRHQTNLNMEGIQRLHVKITSDSITGKEKAFYVGEYAKDKEDKEQPEADDTKKTNKQLHLLL